MTEKNVYILHVWYDIRTCIIIAGGRELIGGFQAMIIITRSLITVDSRPHKILSIDNDKACVRIVELNITTYIYIFNMTRKIDNIYLLHVLSLR